MLRSLLSLSALQQRVLQPAFLQAGCGNMLQYQYQPERHLTNQKNGYQKKLPHKHWLTKWRSLRKLKVMRVKLPNFNEAKENMKLTPEEIRSKMKENGIQPARPWREREIELSCTGEVVEPYLPPEGDGKASIVSTAGARQKAVQLEKKSKSMMAVRKIRTFDEEFDTIDFAKNEAGEIYVKLHEAMVNFCTTRRKDMYELGTYATEKALPEIVHNLYMKTLRWKFLETVEPTRVVHVRCLELISKENMFAQVTCRFHTKQTLALYDRFGRLMYGNELTPKDVLEYVVFEKHLSNLYGTWRVHGKIIPEWSGVGHDLVGRRTVPLEEASA